MTDSAWICAPRRTPFTRASKGTLENRRADDLLAGLFRNLLASLQPSAAAVDEVIVGCAYPEGEQGRNVARAITLGSGLSYAVSALILSNGYGK